MLRVNTVTDPIFLFNQKNPQFSVAFNLLKSRTEQIIVVTVRKEVLRMTYIDTIYVLDGGRHHP